MYTTITVHLNDLEEKTDHLVTRRIPYLSHTSITSSVSITLMRFWSWETCYVLTVSNIILVGRRHNDHNLLVTLCHYVVLLLKVK